MSTTKDVEVHVEYADQQNINKFARHNAKLTELKEELDGKRKELTSLSDAREALDELAILSDIPNAPLLVGETFLIEPTDDILGSLDTRKTKIEKEIDQIQQRVQTIQNVLSDLKVKLYGKFGKSINLENDEE
jgi:prefoldin subunit 4